MPAGACLRTSSVTISLIEANAGKNEGVICDNAKMTCIGYLIRNIWDASRRLQPKPDTWVSSAASP